MRVIIYILLFATVICAQNKIHKRDLARDVKEMVVDTATAIVDTLTSSAKDTINALIEDSLDAANIIDSDQYVDGSIDYDHLSTDVQGRLSSENLYDYQDASVNSALQMWVRWSHYLHEKYYNESDYTYHVPYDVSGDEYLRTRRPLVDYVTLLRELHRETGRAIYWNRMTELVSDMIENCTETVTESGGSKTARTFLMEPDIESDYKYTTFSHNDVPMYLSILYIYQQDTVTYAAYEDSVKNWADICYSYMTRDTLPGWGWGYSYIEKQASNGRLNTTAPFMSFYSALRKDTVITATLTLARLDSIIDSTYATMNNIVYSGTHAGGTVPYLAYKVRPDDAGLDHSYTYTIGINIIRTIENLADTSFTAGIMDSLRKLITYSTYDNGTHYINMERSDPLGSAVLIKFAKKWGLSTYHSRITNGWMGRFLYPGAFEGSNNPLNPGETPRNSILRIGKWLGELVGLYNSETYNESFAIMADDAWGTNETSFYMIDGMSIFNKRGIGINTSETPQVYFRTEDATPTCPDTSTWDYNQTNQVVSFSYPAQGNGLTYDVYKKMGAMVYKVVPSVADSIWFRVDSTTTSNGDSTYLYYYTTSGAFDTLKNTAIAVGDSFTIDGTYGLFTNITRADGPGEANVGMGMICNKTTLRLICREDNGITLYKTYVNRNTLADSAMFFIFRHQQDNFYLNDPSDWQYTFLVAKEILRFMRMYWVNGFSYGGILEDKTQ